MDPPPWGNPYGYPAPPADDYEEEEEEVDNDRADDEDFDVDEEDEEGDEDEDDEPEYQDDSDDDDEEDELDEEEQDEEDARQLQAVARGASLHPVPTAAVASAAGIKRRREDWTPPSQQQQQQQQPQFRQHHQSAAPRSTSAASGGASGGKPPSAKRNVVRINLRQQTVKPKYSELSDEDEGMEQRQPTATAATPHQAWQQPGAAAAGGQAQDKAQAQAHAAAAVQAAVAQQFAVPDWAAHLPASVPAPQPPQQPWQQQQQAASYGAPLPRSATPKPWEQPSHMRHVSSAGALAAKQQSSGSGAWDVGGGSKPVQNFRSTPGFYAESDGEDEQDSRAKRARKVPAVLLPEDELARLGDEVERVIKHRDKEGAEENPGDPWASREFFVKWARYSYLHCTWETKATLNQLAGFKRILNYIKKVEEQEARRPWLSREECELLDVQRQMEEDMVEEHKQVERVIGERQFSDGTVKYLCKWRGLPYCDSTYETQAQLAAVGQEQHLLQFKERERRLYESRSMDVEVQRRAFLASGTRALTSQPDYLKGGTLRDYQLEGLNWMVYSWSRGCNGILADEMGLGKTVQCAAMIGYLSQVQHIAGPFLVVVPLSTVPNWIREFRKWIPSVNAIVYVGDAQSREVLRAFEWETGLPSGRQYKFDVLITTYEMVIKDSFVLRPIQWAYMQVDEAHRLKNEESALYKELAQWSFQGKLLVTGTPLQNNLRELWALLHFLHPEKFPSSEAFEAEYDMKDPEQVARLHATLRPHLLRRVIKDVEKSLPPKNERILRVGMTPLQRQYYRWILSRNFKELNKGARSQLSLLNIITELKKCCNHPFLFQSAEEEYRLRTGGDDDVATRLVLTSGKMVLLDKLLRRLYETKHRVLVFSQMVRMLDIMSDYMRLRGFQHQRLDGSTPAHLRHQAMEHFNAPGSADFAFLLSTRAGGLGINLATADTVIIFDSDWNPQNDLQAMSRAHRIGQKDTVNIYRFVTQGSVEEDILERAKRKMVLDHLVIQRMDTSGRTVLGAGGGQEQAKQMFGKEEMAAILRFGAEELFREGQGAEEGMEKAQEALDAQRGREVVEEDLDAILARAEVVQDTGAPQGGGRMGDLLGQFNVATFRTSEDDAAFWSRLIPEDQRPREQGDGLVIGEPGIRSSRLRQLDAEQLAAAVGDDVPSGGGGAGGDFTPAAGSKKKKKGGEGATGGGGGGGGKKKGGGPEPGAPVEGAVLRIDTWPEEVDGQGQLVGQPGGPRPPDFPLTLSRKDAAAFAKAARQRGVIGKLDLICTDAGGAVAAASERARLALWFGLRRACKEALRLFKQRQPEQAQQAQQTQGGAVTPQASATLSGGGGGGVEGGAEVSSGGKGGGGGGGGGGSKQSSKQPDAKLDWFGVELRAQETLDILRQWRLVEAKLAALPEPLAHSLKLTNAECPPLTQWMRSAEWGPREDTALLLGCWRHGINAWERMCADADLLWLAPKLQLAVADQIRSSGKDRETRERHALAMARILHPEKLPKASYLETRAYGILRQIEKVHLKPEKPSGAPGGGAKTRAASRPPLPPGGAGGMGGRGPGAGTRISPALAAVKHAAAHQAAASFEGGRRGRDETYQAAENLLGADTMTIVRKIRTLQRKGGEMEPRLVALKTRKYLQSIGDKIESESVGDIDLRHSLWDFVSHYTENQESGEQLEQAYERMKEQQPQQQRHQGQESQDQLPTHHAPPQQHAGEAPGGAAAAAASAAPSAAALAAFAAPAPQEAGLNPAGAAAPTHFVAVPHQQPQQPAEATAPQVPQFEAAARQLPTPMETEQPPGARGSVSWPAQQQQQPQGVPAEAPPGATVHQPPPAVVGQAPAVVPAAQPLLAAPEQPLAQQPPQAGLAATAATAAQPTSMQPSAVLPQPSVPASAPPPPPPVLAGVSATAPLPAALAGGGQPAQPLPQQQQQGLVPSQQAVAAVQQALAATGAEALMAAYQQLQAAAQEAQPPEPQLMSAGGVGLPLPAAPQAPGLEPQPLPHMQQQAAALHKAPAPPETASP